MFLVISPPKKIKVGFVSIAAVTFVFWIRVYVAIDEREKRTKREERQKELRVKRLLGDLTEGEAAELSGQIPGTRKACPF